MPNSDSTFLVSDTSFLTKQNDTVSGQEIVNFFVEEPDSCTTHSFIGFEGESHPSVAASEDWVFGSLILFFLLIAFSFLRSSHWIFESLRTFFKVKTRSNLFSKATANDFQSRLFLLFSSLGIMTLFYYSASTEANNDFRIITYLSLLGIVLLFFGVKHLMALVLGYVFTDRNKLKLTVDSYLNTITYLGISLFPLLIFYIYSADEIKAVCLYTSLLFIILAALIVIIKLFQIFYRNFVVTFYILLYLCTLEIVPFIFLLWSFRALILDV